VRVLFVGDGELRAELEVAAQGLTAQFLGFINIDELPSIYCAADVLAHPAEIETFGVIVLEAAILGLPLVLSDRVGAIGPTSIARPGENAIVHRCGDTGALTQALRRLADEQHTIDRMSRASLVISEELDGRKSVSGTVAAIECCLGRQVDKMAAAWT
jgi:glycosyltransferase involved in cell wall biosynthesis